MSNASVLLAYSFTTAAAVPLTVNRAISEVATLVAGLLVIMWAMPIIEAPYWTRYVLAFGLLGFMIGCHWREHPNPRDLGLRLDNLGTAVRGLAMPTVLIAIAFVGFGWAMDSLREPLKFVRGFLGVPAWGFVQHLMLLAFCHRRMRVVCGDGRRSVVATGVIFGLIHAPNTVLMIACTLGGGFWAWRFDRAPNLFATALSHGVVSTCLSASLPKSILRCTRVGYSYLLH